MSANRFIKTFLLIFPTHQFPRCVLIQSSKATRRVTSLTSLHFEVLSQLSVWRLTFNELSVRHSSRSFLSTTKKQSGKSTTVNMKIIGTRIHFSGEKAIPESTVSLNLTKRRRSYQSILRGTIPWQLTNWTDQFNLSNRNWRREEEFLWPSTTWQK